MGWGGTEPGDPAGAEAWLAAGASAALTGKPSRNYFGTADQPILHPDALQTPQVA